MNHLILMCRPQKNQELPIARHRNQELLTSQYLAYETLVVGLRKLDPELHREFLVRSLNIILDVNDLNELPLIELAGTMFCVLDFARTPAALLNIQNVLQHVCGLLQTAYGGMIVWTPDAGLTGLNGGIAKKRRGCQRSSATTTHGSWCSLFRYVFRRIGKHYQ